MLNSMAMNLGSDLVDDVGDDLPDLGNRCIGPPSGFHDQSIYNGI